MRHVEGVTLQLLGLGFGVGVGDSAAIALFLTTQTDRQVVERTTTTMKLRERSKKRVSIPHSNLLGKQQNTRFTRECIMIMNDLQ